MNTRFKFSAYPVFLCSLIFFIPIIAKSAIDSRATIHGVITGDRVTKTEISILDQHGQRYSLPRELLPKELPIRRGEPFTVEISIRKLRKILNPRGNTKRH